MHYKRAVNMHYKCANAIVLHHIRGNRQLLNDATHRKKSAHKYGGS